MALLLAALFVEVGFVLLVVPWSVLWDRNYFIDVFPQIRDLLTSNYLPVSPSSSRCSPRGPGARRRPFQVRNSEFRVQSDVGTAIPACLSERCTLSSAL
jgi:hypothetical protein